LSSVISRYARTEKALEAAIVESYLQGVSTRRVQDIISLLGVENVSASTVSRISKELDQVVDEFLKRPIELPVRYLFVDASYFKVRSGGQYQNKALFVATGVREDGYREILGAKIADVEDERFWSTFFEELKDRGLRGVRLVISDGHKGIQKAVQESFLGCFMAYVVARLIEAFPVEVPSEVYAVSRMIVVLTPETFAYAVSFALLMDLAAGFYPAYKASLMDPVEAIASV